MKGQETWYDISFQRGKSFGSDAPGCALLLDCCLAIKWSELLNGN